ncbi:MAG: hypothetical protein JJ975_14995, partial [Bacteroidia bacterium]|nr:hypothetical protein [Bacteroidia bacterium]
LVFRSNFNWYHGLVITYMGGGLAFITLLVLIAGIPRNLEQLIQLVFLAGMSAFLLHGGLWFIRGRHVVEIYQEHIVVKSTGAIFHPKPMTFPFNGTVLVGKASIGNFELDRNQIEITGMEGTRRFGQGLNEEELTRVIEDLHQLIADRSR